MEPGQHIPLTIGTAGHVDHGKTALVRALTGTDTDRLLLDCRTVMDDEVPLLAAALTALA